MLARFLGRVASTGRAVLRAVRDCLSTATKPAAPEMILGTLADLTRSMPELVAENAFLRQQIVVLKRGAHPWRAGEARHPRGQVDRPGVHARRPATATGGSALVHVPA